MAKKKEQVTVLADSLDALADNVQKLSEVGRAIRNSKLKERAILTLLKDMTHLPKETIKTVLEALPDLERTYLK